MVVVVVVMMIVVLKMLLQSLQGEYGHYIYGIKKAVTYSSDVSIHTFIYPPTYPLSICKGPPEGVLASWR